MNLIGNSSIKKEQEDMEHDSIVFMLEGSEGKKRACREKEVVVEVDGEGSLVGKNRKLLKKTIFNRWLPKGQPTGHNETV